MNKRWKLGIIIILSFSLICAALLPAELKEHECTGDSCAICLIINVVKNTSSTFILALVILVSADFAISRKIVVESKSYKNTVSLINLKTKLSN